MEAERGGCGNETPRAGLRHRQAANVAGLRGSADTTQPPEPPERPMASRCQGHGHTRAPKGAPSCVQGKDSAPHPLLHAQAACYRLSVVILSGIRLTS